MAMARVLIVGGGFAGVVAAETLAKQLNDDHQITVISRNRQFIFYPALVRLAFGKCASNDVSFDLRDTMQNRRVNFVEAEVARVDPQLRRVITAHGDFEGSLPYDYLIYTLGRRLATERITGFFEHSHNVLNVEGALKFGEAIREFNKGVAVIGECPGARLAVPVYETAFALSRLLEDQRRRDRVRITVISPNGPGFQFGDGKIAKALRSALENHNIEYLPDFPIEAVRPGVVATSNGHALKYNLLMLVPPFCGASAASRLGISNADDYVNVDATMRVVGVERMYAAGDSVNFSGPKMGHMAVHQAEVAAANVAAELAGGEPVTRYNHELMMVIDEGGVESIYVHKDLWVDEPSTVKQGRFWSWAKRAQEKYWEFAHS